MRRAPRRAWINRALIASLVTALVAVPVALGSTSRPQPGQRIDLKALLLATSAADAAPWQAVLEREGVPYQTIMTGAAGAVTDAKLADYATNRAYYQAVIVASEAVVLPAADQAALTKFEQTFAIRQLSGYAYPSADHGLNAPASSGDQGGNVGSLTPAGQLVFPYLKGSVPIDAGSYGYQATPVDAQKFQTLLSGPGNASYLGIYTPGDGRQEMVMTVASNQSQQQSQLLRHGMLSWVTRGVYLGYQRNYLELQVDDALLSNDSWDPATHTTSYDASKAIQMTPADVAAAVSWSAQQKVRLDIAFNGAGAAASPALATAFLANKGSFGWLNHTWDHQNVDCSTQAFIAREATDNIAWASSNGLTIDPGSLVTGEHSGLANSRPGNPGTIDPPDPPTATAQAGGTLAAGTYDYGVTASTPNGETVASTSPATTTATSGTVALSWSAICHATSYKVYRAPAGTTTWSLVGTVTQPPAAFTDAGPVAVSFADTGAAGSAATPPASNTAVVDPYGQNPAFIGALTSAGITSVAGDASKAYPQDPLAVGGPSWPAGTPFTDGPAQVVPRYPTNVYYNTASQAQQLDEYNWLYTAPSGGGGCVPVPNVTTCNAAPVTWSAYVSSVSSIMFGSVMGNDPRPHYFHQANLALNGQADGRVFYPIIDALLARYRAAFQDNAPLVQLPQSQISTTLTRQAQWKANAGGVSAYLQDGRVYVTNTSASPIDVPVTGTTVGDSYGGQSSGWTTVTPGAPLVLEPRDPASTAPPVVTGSPTIGGVLTASTGTWAGTPTIAYDYQWQRCNAQGEGCTGIAGAQAATYTVASADLGARLRAVVMASNTISSVSQARSAATDAIANAPTPTGSGAGTGAGGGGAGQGSPIPPAGPVPPVPGGSSPGVTTGAGSANPPRRTTPRARRHLRLSRVGISRRRMLALSDGRRAGGPPIATRIRWTSSGPAKVRIRFERIVPGATCPASAPRTCPRRYRAVGSIRLAAHRGRGSRSFDGRIGRRALRAGTYRISLTATDARGELARARPLTLTIVGS